jgi:hypothetical protein
MNTPTPWRFIDRSEVSGIPSTESSIPFAIEKAYDNCVEPIADICNFPPSSANHTARQRANAALIVRAVNSHQSLIDALSEAVNLFRGGDLTNEQAHALWKADAALALAKEPT